MQLSFLFQKMSDNVVVRQFGKLNVQVYGTYNAPLFKAKDIGEILQLSNIRATIKDYNEKQAVVNKVYTAGQLRDTLMLTERGLYKVLMTSRSKLADQFQDWVTDVLSEIRLTGEYKSRQQIDESNARITQIEQEKKQLQQELNDLKDKTYDEVLKEETLYVFTTDVDGVYKIGETSKQTSSTRRAQIQTGCVEPIETVFEILTHDSKILERVVHYVLKRYRCSTKTEHFRCSLEYIKMIIRYCGTILNIVKGTYHVITPDQASTIILGNMLKDGLISKQTMIDVANNTDPQGGDTGDIDEQDDEDENVDEDDADKDSDTYEEENMTYENIGIKFIERFYDGVPEHEMQHWIPPKDMYHKFKDWSKQYGFEIRIKGSYTGYTVPRELKTHIKIKRARNEIANPNPGLDGRGKWIVGLKLKKVE